MKLSCNTYPYYSLTIPQQEALRVLHEMIQALEEDLESNTYKRLVATCLASIEEELLCNRLPDSQQLHDLLRIVSSSKELTSYARRLADTLQGLSLTGKDGTKTPSFLGKKG